MIEQTVDKNRISCGLVRGIPKEETMEKQWFQHSGKAPCHVSLAVQQFFGEEPNSTHTVITAFSRFNCM
jgi:hypothetical protein